MVPEHPPEGFVYFIGRVLAQDELFHFVVAVQPVGRGEVNKAGILSIWKILKVKS